MSEPTQIEMMSEAELRREIGELIAQNISVNAKLSTLEGIIQKQKEALSMAKRAFESLPALENGYPAWVYDGETAVIEALALSPSTFASRFVEREKVKQLEDVVGCLARAIRAGAIMLNPATLNADILAAHDSFQASQQPEGAGKE